MKNFKFLLVAAMLMGTTATVFAESKMNNITMEATVQPTKLQYNPKLSTKEQRELEKTVTVLYLKELHVVDAHVTGQLRNVVFSIFRESKYFEEASDTVPATFFDKILYKLLGKPIKEEKVLCKLFGKSKEELEAYQGLLLEQVAKKYDPQLISTLEEIMSHHNELVKAKDYKKAAKYAQEKEPIIKELVQKY